jgi:hypothetical protein
MNENAAARLHQMLEQWRVVPIGTQLYGVREAPSDDDYGFWVTQLSAAALLAEVDQDIAGLRAIGRNVAPYERAFPKWSQAVFVPNVLWNDPNNTYEIVDQTTLDLLYSLSEIIRGVTPRPALDPHRAADSRTALNDLTDLLSAAQVPLSDAALRYVFELINSVRTALDEASVTGSVDLLHRVNELVGFLKILADELGADEANAKVADKVREYSARIVPWVVISANTAFTLLGAAADFKALTPGG